MRTSSERYSLENSYHLVSSVARLKECVRLTPRIIWLSVAASLTYVAKYRAATPNLNRIPWSASWLAWGLRRIAKATGGLDSSRTMNVLSGELIQLINDQDKETHSERVVGLSDKPALSGNAASNCRLLEVVMLIISRLADEVGQAAAQDWAISDDNDEYCIHLMSLLNNAYSVCKACRSWFTMGPQVVYRFHNPAFSVAEWPVV